MFDIETTLAEYGLTPERYEELLRDCSDKVHKVSDMDWSEISEKYNISFNPDTLRKGSQPPLIGGTFVREYFKWKEEQSDFENNSSYQDDLMAMKRELERAKIQFRDERNAWQKQNYIDARAEQKLDLLEEELKTLGRINFEHHSLPVVNGDNEMIITLSDLHIGQCFDSIFGVYNSDIAENRLGQYLDKIKTAAKIHEAKSAHVFSLGDQLSGSIHKSIAVTNRENVIQQIKRATELISSFCYELTKIFECVTYYSVSGNHTRIDKKNEALHDERLDDIIAWGVSLTLSHIDNFTYNDFANYDTGISSALVCGKQYVMVHGDFDAMTKQGVANLCMMLGYVPDGIFRGHMHYPAMNELNGVKVIQSGSLAGSGDDHTIEMRLTGKPCQTMCICDSSGIDCIYHVDLS